METGFNLSLHFLGVGNASALELGSSSCLLKRNGDPLLLIDCGFDTVARYREIQQDRLPRHIFITHAHLDHIGGLENLFYRAYFTEGYAGRIKLYVPVELVATLHRRLAGPPMPLAEGGANFWDSFHLIPVSDHFWHENLLFRVFPVRHHDPGSSYGLSLEGVFLYTGDTRPIPDVITQFACRGETIFHDCGIQASPSHTGVGELGMHYTEEQRLRMVLYHYESAAVGDQLERLGYRVARCGQPFLVRGAFHEPRAVHTGLSVIGIWAAQLP